MWLRVETRAGWRPRAPSVLRRARCSRATPWSCLNEGKAVADLPAGGCAGAVVPPLPGRRPKVEGGAACEC